MTQHSLRSKEFLFSAASAGFFFILIGSIFAYTAFMDNINLFNRILDFLRPRNWELVEVPNTRVLLLPMPVSPSLSQQDIYRAVVRFSVIWGFYQVVIFVLRLFARSPISKKAETVSNAVFWVGTGYLANTFLIESARINSIVWFAFWAQMIMLFGFSLIARAVILAVQT